MLQRQNIEVPFSGDLDTKSDSKLVLPGKFLTLENGVYTKGGEKRKRNGHRVVTGDPVVDGDHAVGNITPYRDELVAMLGERIYTLADSNSTWVEKGDAVQCKVTLDSVVRNTYQQSTPDAATNNGVTVYAWADSRGGVRASVVDEATGSFFLTDVSISATAARPRVLPIGAYTFVVYYEAGDIKARRLTVATPTAFATATTLATDGNTTAAEQHLDVSASIYAGAGVIVYSGNVPDIKIIYLLASGSVGQPSNGYPAPIAVTDSAISALSVALNTATGSYAIVYANGTNVRRVIVNSDFTVAVAAGTIEAIGTAVNITAAYYSTTRLYVFYEITAAATYNRFVKIAIVHPSTGAVSGVQVWWRSVGLASKSFVYRPSGEDSTDNRVYVVCVHDSTLQPTYFLMGTRGAAPYQNVVAARIAALSAGGVQSGQLPSMVRLSEAERFWPAPQRTRFVTEVGTIGTTSYSLIGLSRSNINMEPTAAYQAAELNKILHIAGGVVSMYDGHSVVEHGFFMFPENVAAPTLTATGGSMVPGTYQMTFVWAWDDNQGSTHRSAPMVPISFTHPAGTSTNRAAFVVPTLRITQKQDGADVTKSRTNIRLEAYSTEANGTVFYKTPHQAQSVLAPVYNTVASDTVAFERTVADTSITSNELLYTTGGVLENICPPAASLISAGKDRLFLSGLEDPTLTWYSKRMQDTEGVAFHDLQTIRSAQDGGDITAQAFMDDKLVTFKHDAICIVSGDGPDDTGGSNTFTESVLVTTDVGCSNPDSIAVIPDGLVFQSAKGIYILSRALQAGYIGAPVESFNSQTITAATLLEDKNQVRFVCSDGNALVYDYFFRGWTTFTNHEGLSACLFDSTYHYLRANGDVFRETEDFYKDDTREISMLMETAWLKFGGIQGYQRARRVAFLGEFHSDHMLEVSIAYDYQPFEETFHYFDPASALYSTTYGEDSPYGEGTPYGGTGDLVYQFRHHLGKQKCQAIKFRIRDIGSKINRAYSLTSLAMEVGVKAGLFKMGAAKTIG